MTVLSSGTRLNQRYEVLQFIDRGDFGETYIARDKNNKNLNHLCAVKRFQPKDSKPESMRKAKELFFREADVLQRLPAYPYIPKFLDRFEENLEGIEDFYIVYEWIPGKPLSEEVKSDEPCSEERVLEILRETLEILDFVHRHRVIHRDVKPSNMIVREGDGKIILIDFGIVKDASLPNNPRNKPTTASTNLYAPQEQKRGHHYLNNDLYALGMIAIELLTRKDLSELIAADGQVLWHNDAQVQKKELVAIIDKMVHLQYSERYVSAKEVLHDLDKIEEARAYYFKLPKQGEVNKTKNKNFAVRYLVALRNKNRISTRKKNIAFIVSGGIFTVTLASLLILTRSSIFTKFKPCKTFFDPERLDQAPNRCLESSQLKPDFVMAFTERGDALYYDENFTEALKFYEKANKLNPNSSTVLTGIGNAYYKLYLFKEMDEYYKKATELDPKTAIEWNSHGDAYFALNRLEEARTSYRKATELDNNQQNFWIDFGDVLYKLDRDDEALEAYEKAIELNQNEKDQIRAWIGKGNALFGLKKLNEAFNAFEKAQDIDPQNPQPWSKKGLVLDEKGETRNAQNAYGTVIEKCDRLLNQKPDDLEVLSKKAEALGKLKKNEEALKIWNDITDKYPTYFPAQMNRADLLSRAGRYDEALAVIDIAIKLVPEWKRPEALLNKGSFLIGRRSEDRSQDLQAAVEAFTEALDIDPNFVRAFQDRGQAYMALGKRQEALNDFDRSVQIDNQDSKSWILRGAVLAAMGRNEDALTSIEGGIRLDQSDPVAWWQKGILLEKLKLENEALEAYDRAIKLSPAFQQAIEARKKLQEKL